MLFMMVKIKKKRDLLINAFYIAIRRYLNHVLKANNYEEVADYNSNAELIMTSQHWHLTKKTLFLYTLNKVKLDLKI